MERFEIAGRALELCVGDITHQTTQAIANAANSGLLGGGGVDGAIHRAAGPRLLEACRALKRELASGRLPTGCAALTPGFDLAAKSVVHCVGPVYESDPGRAPSLLAGCYREALRLCVEHAIDSIAFPSISTGAYGYPVEKAAPVALETVAAHLRSNEDPRTVRFVLFDERTFATYLAAARRLLGAPVSSNSAG